MNKSKLILLLISWGYINNTDNMDKEIVKQIVFTKGYEISQRFKNYPAWDNIIEPFIIKQCSFIFSVGNSFIDGMISDNDNETENLREKICNNKV